MVDLCTNRYLKQGRPLFAAQRNDTGELKKKKMEGTCAGCRGGFKAGDQVLSALDQKWHPQHFTCSCMATLSPVLVQE